MIDPIIARHNSAVAARTFLVKRLGVASFARWGLAAGALVACVPGVTCSFLFFVAVSSAHRLVESWRDVGVTVFGQRLALDMIELLHLQPLLDALRILDALGVFGILLFGLLLSLGLGLIVALAFALLGLFYNFTGRLELELAEK